MAIHWLV